MVSVFFYIFGGNSAALIKPQFNFYINRIVLVSLYLELIRVGGGSVVEVLWCGQIRQASGYYGVHTRGY